MQQARESNSRGSNRNPNYVQITNLSGRRVIKRRVAEHWINCGRAAWISPSQIRLLKSVYNTAGGYDDVDVQFEMVTGTSGNFTVVKFEKGRRPQAC